MSPDRSAFVVSIEIPVAWGEQDAFGHLNNVVYFRYFESVRMHYLERIGVLRSHNEEGIGVILASTTCDFKRPVEWPMQLTVRTGCTLVGNTSFTMQYEVLDDLDTVVATGTSVQVMYDYNKGHKVPVPETIRRAVEAVQHG
ncbi:MAG: acyl-CoA thioesterase [Flavobacteriales bacterium]|nr:acyl-CoA thioesterase [Flavobacteriales bacterium]HRH70661.1 thioesterase family protein [Flavobacteriales bacterium]